MSSPELRSPLLVPVPSTDLVHGQHIYSKPEKEKLTIEDVLQKHCGEFGPWQIQHFILTSLAWAIEACHAMVMIYADHEPSFVCVGASGCDERAKSVCGFEPGSWQWRGGSSVSTVAQWGLACDQKYKIGVVQAIFFGGCMIGAGIFGHLSDSSLGRKGTLRIVCTLSAVFGCITAMAPSYRIYLLLRLLTGFSAGGIGLCAFVLATEPVGPHMRGIAGMSTFYFFSAGIALLSAIAYACHSWRTLYVASSIPSIIFILAVLPFISESPRWYLVRGRKDEAMKLISAIATSNGNQVPEGVTLSLDEEVNRTESSINGHCEDRTEKEAVTGTLLDVVSSPITRIRLFLAVGINFLCSIVYYGLSLNVVNLETNLYLNVVLNAVAEMPAYAITAALLDRLGRKPLTVGTQWFSCVFCFVGCLVGNGRVWRGVKMVCGVLGIFGMAGTYNLLFIYTAELFPTVVRNAALGCTSQAGQLGAILAPVVVVLGGGLPFAVFSMCGFVGGILAFFLPETLNRPLHDTMSGMVHGEAI